MNSSSKRYEYGMLAAAILILITYHVPWVINPGAGLTLNAPDLAEWTTLHPAESANNPPLMTGLLLRLPLVSLAPIIGLNSGRVFALRWWLAGCLIVLLVALAAPPLEFITESRDNRNYRQEFMIALAVAIAGTIGLTGAIHRWRTPILIAGSIAGFPAALVGLANAYNLMIDFYLPTQIGLGGILTAAALALIATSALVLGAKNRAAH